WDAFLGTLGTLVPDAGQQERIAASAARCFECVGEICAALYPYAPDALKHHVTAINFEAGDHAMPQRPAEIGLGVRAGNDAWRMFPYLEQRYGERGRRFTNSDSCWLVTLTRAPRPEAVSKALDWLRTVLSTRGIPTLILEAHLRAIKEAIAEDLPG